MSLLPTLSKMLERVIYNRFYNYLSEKNMLIKEQFGFRPSFSTETALLHALEQITAALERKEIPLAIYVDLSKAFDSLDHNILLRNTMIFVVCFTIGLKITSVIVNNIQVLRAPSQTFYL